MDSVEDDSPWDSDPKSGQSDLSSPNCRHCPALRSASTHLSNEQALLGDLLNQSNTELSAPRKKISHLEAEKIHLQTTLAKLESRYFVLSGETSFLENQLSSTHNTYASQSVIWQQQVSEVEGQARGHYTTVKNLRRQVECATASAAEFK
jgi:predicted nuclease with TOPRIM domain